MLNKQAAAEQLRKYATVARLIREQRMMQKRAGWFWPSKPKPKTVDNSHVLRPSPGDRQDMIETLNNGNKTTARERGEMTDYQKRLKAWQQEGYNSTRGYQPGDWLRIWLGSRKNPTWYDKTFPMPENYEPAKR